MKVIFTTLLAFAGYLGSLASLIWAVVEFILHVMKNDPFNWWSVWITFLCSSFCLVMIIYSSILNRKRKEKTIKMVQSDTISRIEKQLNEMREKRKNTNKNI